MSLVLVNRSHESLQDKEALVINDLIRELVSRKELVIGTNVT